jgi:hypothetical protein
MLQRKAIIDINPKNFKTKIMYNLKIIDPAKHMNKEREWYTYFRTVIALKRNNKLIEIAKCALDTSELMKLILFFTLF